MGDYIFETVWPDPPTNVRSEVIDFWLRESALTKDRALERVKQLVLVCRDTNGDVAAVSTAFPRFVESLQLRCFYFRAFVGRHHRVRGLRSGGVIFPLVRTSYDVLNERFQQGMDADVVGLYFEVENPSLKRHRNLIWTDLGANVVFIGRLPNGSHARVWYFEHAKLARNSV